MGHDSQNATRLYRPALVATRLHRLKTPDPHAGVWHRPGFLAYLQSTAFSGMAFSMQQLLVSWLLIGVLLLPADNVGLLQALMGLPGIFLMLWGVASADRRDPRGLLVGVYAITPLCPVFLIAMDQSMGIAIWSVVLWGLGMSVAMSFSTPAQQAILSRVSGNAIQQGVSASTAAAFLVQITGIVLAGQMEHIGLTTVLGVQALCLGLSALMIRRIDAWSPGVGAPHGSQTRNILEGFRATYGNRTIFNVLVINFISSIFNAGAFMTVLPFIVKRIYDGDAAVLATMMAVFFAGATMANVLMYRLMPFTRPGRLYLMMQLSRIAILFVLWIEPSWPVFLAAIVAWGINMGFTTTLARTIVQETAEEAFRARILSVFTLGMMGSAPIGAIVLGFIIETFGTLPALIPAMGVSLALCILGIWKTNIWSYRSPVALPG